MAESITPRRRPSPVRMVVVACCLGLGSLRVGPFLGAELEVGGVKEVGVVDTQVDQRSLRVRFARPDTTAILD